MVMPAGISAGVLVPLAGFCARATMQSANAAAAKGRIEERLNECTTARRDGAASERRTCPSVRLSPSQTPPTKSTMRSIIRHA